MQEERPTIIGMLDGTYEKTCRVFDPFGLCPSLEARDYKDAVKILIECEQDGAEECQKESSDTEDI